MSTDFDDFDDCDDEREVYLRKWHIWHQRQTGTPQWKAYRQGMFTKRGQRCAKCNRVGGRLAVHHLEYQHPNVNLWEYADDAVEVVCAGRCHKQADREREEEYRERISNEEIRPEDRIYFPPNEQETVKLAQYARLFQQWLRENYQVEPTETWPLWYHWNVLGEQFMKTLPPPPRQMKLF